MYKRQVLDYRQVAKLKSTYADGLGAFIREDGRIHGTFNQTITATGRISSTEPNLQNIPVRMEPVSYTHLDVYKRQVHTNVRIKF